MGSTIADKTSYYLTRAAMGLAVTVLCLGSTLAWGQEVTTIPPGTVISRANWQQYKQFMSPGMQAEWARSPDDTVGAPPDAQIVVGPTVHIPMTRQYVADTERYSPQVGLKALPTGGFVPTNYIAGMPFPWHSLNGPNAGIKAAYDAYYQYIPYIVYDPHDSTYLVDSNGSTIRQVSVVAALLFDHRSEPGMPVAVTPDSPFFFANYSQVLIPEQSKYLTSLTILPNDPSHIEDLYTFIPSLRRAIHLSRAARCAPLQGTDYFTDDIRGGFNAIPSEFYADYMGEHKYLELAHMDPQTFPDMNNWDIKHIMWPKPIVGKWEVRDQIVLALRPIPAVLPAYCYSKRVLYIDKDDNQLVGADLYDMEGKFWKVARNARIPLPLPNSPGEVEASPYGEEVGVIADLQNNHFTSRFAANTYLNNQAPKQVTLARFGTPEGLSTVMR